MRSRAHGISGARPSHTYDGGSRNVANGQIRQRRVRSKQCRGTGPGLTDTPARSPLGHLLLQAWSGHVRLDSRRLAKTCIRFRTRICPPAPTVSECAASANGGGVAAPGQGRTSTCVRSARGREDVRSLHDAPGGTRAGLPRALLDRALSGQADGVVASAMRQRREARSRVYEPLVRRSGWSEFNRRVGRHDRGRAWLERAVTVIT